MNMFLESKEGIIIQIKAVPNAQITKIAKEENGFLKIKINAPGEKGKANAALIKYLAKLFKLPQSNIQIIQGELNRQKKILVIGISLEELKKIIEKELAS